MLGSGLGLGLRVRAACRLIKETGAAYNVKLVSPDDTRSYDNIPKIGRGRVGVRNQWLLELGLGFGVGFKT